MALTISISLDADRLAPVVEVDGIPAGTATITINRTSPSGNTTGVRGYVNRTVAAGTTTLIARDYEAPFNVELTYTATCYNAAGAAVGTATATFEVEYDDCEAWLVHLARPTNSLEVVIESLVQLTFDIAAGVHRVLARRDPVLTSLPAYTPSGELVVLTDTLVERDQVRAILGDGYPVLVRTDPDLGIGNLYVGITSFVEERFMTLGRDPHRRFRAAVVQVARPDPGIYVPVAPNTYQNVKDTFATYADLKAAVGTYDQLAYTYPANEEAQPIAPWLPDDI